MHQIFKCSLILNEEANDLTHLLFCDNPFSQKVTCLDVTIDGLGLISGSADGTIRLWNIQSKQCTRCSSLKGLSFPLRHEFVSLTFLFDFSL
jgi:WD40 repeat protein